MWQGLTVRSLKHHYSLYPLYAATLLGAAGAAYYIFRLTRGADASWARNKNPHPWNNIPANRNIKFLSAGRVDFKNLKKNGPDM